MEHGACNVIYIDRRANDEHVRTESLSSSLAARTSTGSVLQSYFGLTKTPSVDITTNLEAILSMFAQVHICKSGSSCLRKLNQLESKDNIPTLVLIDVPYDDEQRFKRLSREPRTPSPTSTRLIRTDTGEPDDIYGMHLLTHISSQIQSRSLSKLVLPIVVLSGFDSESASTPLPSLGVQGPQVPTDTVRLRRYLDAGAVDVLSSPFSKDQIHRLSIHAYRIHKEVAKEEAGFLTAKRNRKLSWVGVNDAKPYAYLREAMVSSLMSGICNPEMAGDSYDPADLYVSPDRQEAVANAIGTWSFSAHDFGDDELLYASLLMLKHALKMPELEQWGMTDDELTIFLLASRTAYNDFVLYHNFRHVTDVLQALFHFLVRIGILAPYPHGKDQIDSTPKSPVAQLLKPFDALTLLISAIGHDVGHPGVNNAFLVALNAPLAQLYNDRSVLESFHCAAYSQILRRYWPKAFADSAMRKLMINSILATDMGLHFKYMSDLGNLQEKIAHDKGIIDGWNVKIREEHKDLVCGLLIKCADISNVARKFDVAARWANVLTDEFSNQGVMEQELQIPSCLFGGPPVRDDLIKLGESQIGFMNIFARPLFESVADILPSMQFTVDEIFTNRTTWESKIKAEQERKKKKQNFNLGLPPQTFSVDPTPSPFSGPPLRLAPEETSSLQPEPSSTPAPKTVDAEAPNRRVSTGSIPAAVTASRRSSGAVDKGSRRSSATGVPGTRPTPTNENQSQSRRGSGDASLTAILVTQAPNVADRPKEEIPAPARSISPGRRKDTLIKTSPKKTFSKHNGEPDKEGVRPLTAPSTARRSPGPNLYPVPHTSSQCHSEVDLSHTANGNLDGSKNTQWDTAKVSADSTVSRSDTSRDSNRRSEWWRQMSSRRRTRDLRNGETDARGHQKDTIPDLPDCNIIVNTPPSPPGRNSRTEKLKSFFKRKPRNSNEQEKQLSSFGSSSQLRTPPTSDPGRSVNSDD